MKLRCIILFLLLVGANSLFAQVVSLKGKVFDEKNNVKLPRVTVKVGQVVTSTDEKGYFSLDAQLKTLKNEGINFSCIGYLSTHLIYESKHFYEVGLIENAIQLKEVVIGSGDDIIKKAIKRIPENYPNQPIVLKGILRTQTWRNQSEYFKSDALIKAYIPPYDSKEKTTVAVLQNNIDSLYDKSLKYLKHSSNYNIVDFQDIAHHNYIIERISKKGKFDYLFAGKQVYNNHEVFVINTTLRDTSEQHNRIDATFYIDTASYAFVASNIYTYNLVRKNLLPVKTLNYQVNYEQIGKKWYLKNAHTSALFELNKQSPQTTVDFIRTEIDSTNAQPIPYRDVVQARDNILLINKAVASTEWAKTDSLFRTAEREGKLEKISKGLLDTIKQNNTIANRNFKKPFGNRLFDYIAKDNIRTAIGLTKFPVEVSGQSVSESINYGLGLGVDFRLFKNVFIGFELRNNLWNNKHINLSATALNLSNDFIFNKNYRHITLSPYVSFERIAVSYQKAKMNYNTFNCGLRGSYELTHKKALFLSSGFNSAGDRSTLNGLTITPTHYNLGLGILIKI